MRRAAVLASLVAAVAFVLPGAAALADPGPQIEVTGVQTLPGKVRFFVTARGLPTGTSLNQLTVDIDGTPLTATVEPVASTAPAGIAAPRGAVLVVDTSGSMAGAPLAAAKDAASVYAAGLPTDMYLGLVAVSDKPADLLAPTTDRAAFRAAVDQLTANGGTALYDGVHHAAALLASGPSYAERRIVVLSDGADTSSTTTPADLAAELTAGNLAMDVVAFGDKAGGAEISDLATGSGGRLVAAADAAQLRTAFRGIAEAQAPPVIVTVEVPVGLSGHAANLHVALNSAGKSIGAATVPVTFRTDANATAPAAGRFTAHAMPSWLIVAALVGIGGALLVGTFAVLFLAIGRSRMRARLRQLDHFGADRTSQSATQAAEGSIFVRAALALSERAVQRRDQQTTIEAALDRAGIELRPAEWLLLRVIGAAVAGGLLALLLPWYVGLVVGTLLGWAASGAYRHLRTARRARKFGDLLPDALQLLVGALRSGFSLTQGIDALVREGPEPVASEFGRALAETRLGGEMEEALERTAARNSSRDLAWLVMAIRIQREVGGNLSEVLETAVETMRERARLRRHVRGLSAEGRLSAYVLVGMPIALALWMFVVRRSYLRPLYTEPLGIAMLVAAAVMLGIGSFWMSRLVKVEV